MAAIRASRRPADTALGGIPMKKYIDELDGPKSSWLLILVKSLIVLASIGIAACVCLVPIFAMVKVVAAIGAAFDGFFASLFSGLSMEVFWILLPMAAVALCWVLLTCTGGEIAWLLLALLAWLLFGSPP